MDRPCERDGATFASVPQPQATERQARLLQPGVAPLSRAGVAALIQPGGAPFTRRGFVSAALGMLGALLSAAPPHRAALAPAVPSPPRTHTYPESEPARESSAGVLSYRLDRPYWDPSGTAPPYQPPAGARSGDGLAEASLTPVIGQFGYC